MAMLGLCCLAMMQNSVMILVLTPSKQGNLRDEHNFNGGIFVLELSHTLSWKMKLGFTSKEQNRPNAWKLIWCIDI